MRVVAVLRVTKAVVVLLITFRLTVAAFGVVLARPPDGPVVAGVATVLIVVRGVLSLIFTASPLVLLPPTAGLTGVTLVGRVVATLLVP